MKYFAWIAKCKGLHVLTWVACKGTVFKGIINKGIDIKWILCIDVSTWIAMNN